MQQKDAGRCRKMQEDAGICRKMPEDAGRCRKMAKVGKGWQRMAKEKALAWHPLPLGEKLIESSFKLE